MELSNLAKIFKALSNEQRLTLFHMIYKWSKECKDSEQNCHCSEGIKKSFTRACKCMDIARSTISHHFKELQNAGLITCTRYGQAFVCKINEDAIDAVIKLFQ